MQIQYNTEELTRALDDFYIATGVNTAISDAEFNIIAGRAENGCPLCSLIQKVPQIYEKCRFSDRELMKKCRETLKPERHVCHAGLTDIAAPIILNNKIVGYIILGQIRTSEDFEKIYGYLSKYKEIELSDIEKNFISLPIYNDEKIKSITNTALMLTEYILVKNMLKTKYDSRIDIAEAYINKNLTSALSVEMICKNVNISKSSLYRLFDKTYGKTVSEYINYKRIKKAENLLLNSESSLEEISESIGFSNYPYFCKMFKKLNGISPLKYRKKAEKN